MSVLDEVLQANQTYVSDFGDKASLALPPARHFAMLTCMDARLDPAKYAGLAEGDADQPTRRVAIQAHYQRQRGRSTQHEASAADTVRAISLPARRSSSAFHRRGH